MGNSFANIIFAWNSQFAPENRGPSKKEIPDLETTILRGKLVVLDVLGRV